MNPFEFALGVALGAHSGQTDKAGEPYIRHVLRVMAAVPAGDAEIVALLHDVVEDSTWTIPLLAAQGFSGEVMNAVAAITRRQDEVYADYIARVATDPLATTVKLADLRDNLAPERRASLPTTLALRYERALVTLNPALPVRGSDQERGERK